MNSKLTTFTGLLRERPAFRLIWVAQIISLIGDWLSYIAVSLISIERGDGAMAVAWVLAAHALPMAIMSPISGPLADRYDRRHILIFSYLAASILTLCMWWVSDLSVALLQAMLFLRVCVSSVGSTARTASIPQVVRRDELHSANALMGLTWSITFAVGLALGGFAAAFLGPSGAILLDVLTFLLAVCIYWRLPSLLLDSRGRRRPRPGIADMWSAWTYVGQSRRHMATLWAKSPAMMVNAGGWVTLNLIAGDRMSWADVSVALGLMHTVRAVGTGIGPLLPEWLLPRSPFAGPPLVFLGVTLFAFGSHPFVYWSGLFLWGCGGGHNWVSTTAALQSQTPRHLMGRVSGLDFLLLSISESMCALAGAWVVDQTGYAQDCTLSSLIMGAFVWCGLVLWVRGAPPPRTPPEENEHQEPETIIKP